MVVGAGFSGAVLARQLAEALDCEITVWDEREHIAGNCYTARDADTGVMVHRYGPHIFNTNNEAVWNYVRKFGVFEPYVNRVKAVTARGVFSLPINLLTINQLFGKTFSPEEARKFVGGLGDQRIAEPRNFEEQALKMVGPDLYEVFFKGYTVKQWGCDPRDLPAAILKRLPIRFNYDDNYYDKQFQGIPREGYSSIVAKILDHPRIGTKLGMKFPGQAALRDAGWASRWDRIFYTGPLDSFFEHRRGRLGYRTVTFEKVETDAEDFQGTAVINYTSTGVPWTRIHEHKHFAPWEKHQKTTVFREYSKETEADDTPYYPKRLARDKELLKLYRDEASALNTQGPLPVTFLGRLATYRYMDMETVIGEAMDLAERVVSCYQHGGNVPAFPNDESPA